MAINPQNFFESIIELGNGIGDAITNAAQNAVNSIKNINLPTPNIDLNEVLVKAMTLPTVKIDRSDYLKKELIKKYPSDVVELAISTNPAYAGITRTEIDKIANSAINYETNITAVTSAAAGVPGGLAMAATIPADLAQYFAHILRVMQKLAYLYGFSEFNLSTDSVDDDTMNEVLIFLGVMFSVDGANQGVKIIAQAASQKIAKTLPRKALTKTAVYPIVKKVFQFLGVHINRQIFANGVSKAVPVIGGVVSGGVTYATFKPNCHRLKNNFRKLNLSDPDFYKKSLDELNSPPER